MAPYICCFNRIKHLWRPGMNMTQQKERFEPNLKFGPISFMLVESSFLG
jgi:hypothetical protein